MRYFILVTFLVLFLACKESKNKLVEADNLELNEIPKNVDNDFNIFLEFFSKDSMFQMSRIDFPMKVKYLNIEDGSLENRIILDSDYYLKHFLPYNPKSKDYTQDIIIRNKEAVISIVGKENGMVVEYIFKKVNGKWTLITWTDQST